MCLATQMFKVQNYMVVALGIVQVGNLTRDRNYWGRPERANIPRPVVSLTSTRPGTDVVAMTAAALAAASVAIKEESSQVQETVCKHCVHRPNKDISSCELSSGLVSCVAAQGMVVAGRAFYGARTVIFK